MKQTANAIVRMLKMEIKGTGNTHFKNALKLMRIPFSVFLMPVYWFALSNAVDYNTLNALNVFIILHLIVYPASNGYNSYMDKDVDSVGGLKEPPAVTRHLLWMVVMFDFIAIFFSILFINVTFAFLVTVYLLVSKAYSYDKTRLKKLPVVSTATVTIFQGIFTYLMVQVGLEMKGTDLFSMQNLTYGIISTLFLCGSYPLTQVYQHQADEARGDLTISRLLGVRGTFRFSEISFAIASVLLITMYLLTHRYINALVYVILMIPAMVLFFRWNAKVRKSISEANFENTMKMNKTSSLLLSSAFILMIILNAFL